MDGVRSHSGHLFLRRRFTRLTYPVCPYHVTSGGAVERAGEGFKEWVCRRLGYDGVLAEGTPAPQVVSGVVLWVSGAGEGLSYTTYRSNTTSVSCTETFPLSCRCEEGAPTREGCLRCAPGSHPNTSRCVPCPDHSTTTRLNTCTCDPGYAGQVTGDVTRCAACPPDQYSTGGVCLPCLYGTVSLAGAARCHVMCPTSQHYDGERCADCAEGYYGDGFSCTKCSEGQCQNGPPNHTVIVAVLLGVALVTTVTLYWFNRKWGGVATTS